MNAISSSRFLLRLIVLVTLCANFLSCARKEKYDPSNYLDAKGKDKFLSTIIRYTAKAPEGVDDNMKFNKKYDAYYLDKQSRMTLEEYYPVKGEVFFLITQPAPSLVEKRNATGGRAKFDADGRVVRYEEVFRTWKMIPDTLKHRSHFLFDKMVNGESLEPFLTKNAADNYIEFPDDKVFYDVANRRWAVRNEADSLSRK